jgi:monoterpene epsilon-lactone hydrolase
MTSWQAAIAKMGIRLYAALRPRNPSVVRQRARMDALAGRIPLARGSVTEPVDAGGVSAEWIAAPGVDSGRALFYLHGGAYCLGSITTHRAFVSRLARAGGMRALAIDYRLAPEHPFPAALEDSLAAYRWLLARGIDPARIIIAGDSAGGGLALATLVALRDAGEPLPAGVVCLSPWTDLAGTGDSVQSRAGSDPMFGSADMGPTARAYAGGRDLKTPLVSPLYADLRGLPPMLLQVGTDEILLDDSVRLAERAHETGVSATLTVWQGMFHVFQTIPFLPEAWQAIAAIGAFMRERIESGVG